MVKMTINVIFQNINLQNLQKKRRRKKEETFCKFKGANGDFRFRRTKIRRQETVDNPS